MFLNIEIIFHDAGVDDYDGCMRWAFGDDYMIMRIVEGHLKWNERHGDIFIIHGSDLLVDAFYKIGLAYKAFQKNIN